MPAVSAASSSLLRCHAVEVGHAGSAILPRVDLSIGAGEFWAVIGRNGSGKTTWLRTLLGLLPPVAGRVERARPDLRLSYLPQRSGVDELYPVLARDVVRLGVERRWSFLSPFGREPESVARAIEDMGIADIANRPFRQLSEGQKQRVLFARLAASDAEIALLDEPTSAMDLVAEREAFELLERLRQKHGMTIVVISHYLGLAREFADHAVLLNRDAQQVVSGTPDAVFGHEVFRASYGGPDSMHPDACAHDHRSTDGDG